jgi:hypothetical protein
MRRRYIGGMANNRMYLECTYQDCYHEERRQILLAKTFGGGYDHLYHGVEKIDEFLEQHQTCGVADENCFRIVYERGEPELKT